MKKEVSSIIAMGLLSFGNAPAFQGLSAPLSLDRPYGVDRDPPVGGTYPLMRFDQADKPAHFNIFRYVRCGHGGLQLAVFFK